MEQQDRHITDVTAEDFPQAVLQRSHEVPVVVDFWAAWCGPCKTLGPLLEKAAEDYRGTFHLAKVDVDANQALAADFGVQGIPMVIAFRDGVPVSTFTGVIPESQLRSWLDGLMPTEADGLVDAARDAALEGDSDAAEQLFQAALAEVPDHVEAGTGLAGLLIAKGDPEEALIVLGKLPPTPDVERLQAAARLNASRGGDLADLETKVEADPANPHHRLDLARALAAKGEFEPALDHMLSLVREKSELRDESRKAMLDIFDVLGNEHPLTQTYRRQLASALF